MPPYKLEPGGPGYEIVYGTTGVLAYLLSLTPANDLQATFDAIALYEQNLVKPLLSFLTDSIQYKRGVRIIGNTTADLTRAPTICFVVAGQRPMKSKDIVNVFDQKGGVRFRGSFPRIIFNIRDRLAFVTVISMLTPWSTIFHPSLMLTMALSVFPWCTTTLCRRSTELLTF